MSETTEDEPTNIRVPTDEDEVVASAGATASLRFLASLGFVGPRLIDVLAWVSGTAAVIIREVNGSSYSAEDLVARYEAMRERGRVSAGVELAKRSVAVNSPAVPGAN